MHVLYAEVQGRTMDPANGEPSSLNLQADSKHQTNIRCCQRVPSASCATSTAAAEAPAQRAEHAMAAEPAMSAEPAGVTGSEPAERAVPVMPQHTQGQSVAIAAEVDARSLSHTVPSSQNPVVEMLQSPHSKLAEESNPATVKQQQNAPLAAASSPQLTASQADSDNAPANRRSGADALQRCNATDETATGNPSCDTTQCVTGQIAGYTWTLPPGMQQEDCVMMWVGPEDAAALTHLQLTFNK